MKKNASQACMGTCCLILLIEHSGRSEEGTSVVSSGQAVGDIPETRACSLLRSVTDT